MPFDKGIDGEPISPSTVTTGDVFNSDIGDGVDYSDPFWLTRTNYVYWFWQGFSIDGWAQTTNGGNVLLNTSRNAIQVASGSTTGNDGRARMERALERGDWDNDLSLAFNTTMLEDTNQIHYAAIGNPSDGNTGVGLKVVDGEYFAVAHNGTTETTSSIDTFTAVDRRDWSIELDAGNDLTVEDTSGNSATIGSANLPTGVGFRNAVELYSETTADANKQLRLRPSQAVRRIT